MMQKDNDQQQARNERADRNSAAADAAALSPPSARTRLFVATLQQDQDTDARIATIRDQAIADRGRRIAAGHERRRQRQYQKIAAIEEVRKNEREIVLDEIRIITGRRIKS